MKVSIITATFNSEVFIKNSIISVNDQNYQNIEHVFIDGMSKDKTVDLINKYARKEKKIISEKDSGIYDALNKGIRAATGDIIGFLHSDDLLNSKTIISEIVEKITQKKIDGVYGDLIYVNKKNISKIIRKWKSSKFNTCLLKRGWMPAHPTLFLRKEVYHKHIGFNINFNISSDYDFMIRVFLDEKLKFDYIAKIIVIMRIGGISNNSLKNIIVKSIEDYRIIKQNKVGGYITLFYKNFFKIGQFFN